MSHAVPLKGQRFAVRFLGRPRAWAWLGGAAVVSLLAWRLAAVPARGVPAAERSWALWSGGVLTAMFAAVMLFSLRKWSIKLAFIRDHGKAPLRAVEDAWAEIQKLNDRVRQGAYADAREVVAAAGEILERTGTHRMQRPEVRPVTAPGGGTLPIVALVRREPFGRVESWLEMHLGLGTVACLGVWLHGDFRLLHPLGWTLAVLSVVVLLSGIAGAILFRILPPLQAAADPGIPFEEAGVARDTYAACLDGILATMEAPARAETQALVRAPSAGFDDLRRRCESLAGRGAGGGPGEAVLARDVAVMAGTREYLRWNTVRARRLETAMRTWRWVHVPASVALLAAILFHVLLVLWY